MTDLATAINIGAEMVKINMLAMHKLEEPGLLALERASKKKAVKKGRALVGYVTQAFKNGQLMSSFQQVKSANKAMAQDVRNDMDIDLQVINNATNNDSQVVLYVRYVNDDPNGEMQVNKSEDMAEMEKRKRTQERKKGKGKKAIKPKVVLKANIKITFNSEVQLMFKNLHGLTM
ncbi:hypothetical protein SCLCIDRAFT_10317 [Scleroderma citrinum Foug A]|uniref:Uncharacterized protein n=1 Tax=Scleroderma citrinum Foug A TaxID=1036808 RepID=A0A0C3DPH9_9AGAM|nr:hypothetical protein SCLCIDRAFT_10317 [Scleroderma citrinum Foug A]